MNYYLHNIYLTYDRIMRFCGINRLLKKRSEDRPSLECRRSVPSANPRDRIPECKPEYTGVEKERWEECSDGKGRLV
jgi:hypothetical protein